MQRDSDWHVIRDCGRSIWVRILDTTGIEGDVVSLAVWEVPGVGKWEWEILVITEDQHVHGGEASSHIDAIAAVEAALLLATLPVAGRMK